MSDKFAIAAVMFVLGFAVGVFTAPQSQIDSQKVARPVPQIVEQVETGTTQEVYIDDNGVITNH